MNEKRKIAVIIGLAAILLVVVQILRLDLLLSSKPIFTLDRLDRPGEAIRLEAADLALDQNDRCLIIGTGSAKATGNLELLLDALGLSHDTVDWSSRAAQQSTESLELGTYACIFLLDSGQDSSLTFEPVKTYVEQGGLLLYLGNGAAGKRDWLRTQPEFLGIRNTGLVHTTNSVYFSTELLSGITGEIQFAGTYLAPYDFFSYLDVDLSSHCQVHLEAVDGTPLIWGLPVVNGKIMVVNTGEYDRKELRGLLTGSLALLKGMLIQPVAAALVLFIDDFPADYRSAPELVRKDYGRNWQRFILEIWWPQIQGIMRRRNLVFTGSYIESFNSQVEPPFPDSLGIENSTDQLATDLILQGGEIALQGYNHQPLASNQMDLDHFGYTAWASPLDAMAAVQKSVSFFQSIFPNYSFYTYVPPSDLMDEAWLPELKQAVPSLRVVSGIYYPVPGDQGSFPEYLVQEIGAQSSGLLALPRITAGSFYTDEVRFLLASVVSTHGLATHMIHPDDLLDPVRSQGLDWEDLYQESDELFEQIGQDYPWLASMSAAEAAENVRQAQAAQVYDYRNGSTIHVICDNFQAGCQLLVTTDSAIKAGTGCDIRKVDSLRYLVSMHQPRITLEVE